MSIREVVATGAPIYVTVHGDGLAPHWLEVDMGLHIVTGRAGMDVRTDRAESAWDAAKVMPAPRKDETVAVGEYRVIGGKLYECVRDYEVKNISLAAKEYWRLVATKEPGVIVRTEIG